VYAYNTWFSSTFPHYYDLLVLFSDDPNWAWMWTSDDPNQHSLKTGEIFHTDGILTRKLYKMTNEGDFCI
jgi:hypothetical protein